jgi:restriction endonuclease Mrr
MISVPISFAKKKRKSPEHEEYHRQVAKIDQDYQRELKRYNYLVYQNQADSLDELRRLKPKDFENHIAYIFKEMGYKVRRTGKSGDAGIDIEASKDGKLVVVQCKRYAETNRVGSPEIRNFIGAITIQSADHGYFVTTSSFTRSARIQANHIDNVTLVDGKGIMKWWQEYGIGPYKDLSPPQKQSYPAKPPPIPPLRVYGFKVWQWVVFVIFSQLILLIFILWFIQ